MDAKDRERAPETLVIELEDAATRSVWRSILGLLSSGTQMWHFVGLVSGRLAYQSSTFAAPYSWGRIPLGKTMLPREEWAAGIDQALEELRAMVRKDGWIELVMVSTRGRTSPTDSRPPGLVRTRHRREVKAAAVPLMGYVR